MGLKLVTAPAEEPITLAQAKAHLRVDVDDDNDLIEALVTAGVDFVDGPGGYLGRALIDQTWDYYLDGFPTESKIEIPLPPLIEVVGVYYLDSNGTEQEFSASSYSVDVSSEPGLVTLLYAGSWPTAQDVQSAVRIRFRAGYLDQTVSPPEDAVPGTIKAAILILVGNMYANRESVIVGTISSQISLTAEYLLRRHRIYLSLA